MRDGLDATDDPATPHAGADDRSTTAAAGRTATTPVALTVVIGAFVLVAVLSVLAVGVWSGYRNTADLLHQKAALVVDAAVDRLSLYLGAAEDQSTFVASALAEGEVFNRDLDAFIPMLGGALAATPQINALYFLDRNHRLTGVERDRDGIVPVFAGLALDPDMRHILAEASGRTASYWADFLWRDTFNALHVNLRTPVWRDGTFQGVVMALVSVPSLSLLIGDLESQFGYNAFILLDEQRVLAHPLLQFGFPGLHRWKPLPTLSELGDPVLNVMWGPTRDEAPLADLVAGLRGHTARLGKDTYVYLYTQVEGFGPRPWTVGTSLRASGLTGEIDRLYAALMVCGCLMLAALIVAGWMGVSIARPARRLALAAEATTPFMAEDAVEGLAHPFPARPAPPPADLPGSGFRELDHAVRAFNSLRTRQHWFTAHAPRTLVGRLAATQRLGQPWAETRAITVLSLRFGVPPGLGASPAPDQAAMVVGQTLDRIHAAVTATGGIVEQAGANGVLAWWGGLNDHPDHAARAVEAARILAPDDAGRPSTGLILALGLDSGNAVVAAVPTADRLTVTAIGTPVHTAEAIALLAAAPLAASAATVRAAGLNAVSLGLHMLDAGGARRTQLFRLE